MYRRFKYERGDCFFFTHHTERYLDMLLILHKTEWVIFLLTVTPHVRGDNNVSWFTQMFCCLSIFHCGTALTVIVVLTSTEYEKVCPSQRQCCVAGKQSDVLCWLGIHSNVDDGQKNKLAAPKIIYAVSIHNVKNSCRDISRAFNGFFEIIKK